MLASLPQLFEPQTNVSARQEASLSGDGLEKSPSPLNKITTPHRSKLNLVEGQDNSDAEVVIRLRNLHKTYLLGLEGVPALRGVNLEIHRGEWVVVYGTSGGGKTSLLNIVGTIDKPTKGSLEICGKVIDYTTSDDTLASIRLYNLGFVFQSFNLLPAFSALENVELPLMLRSNRSTMDRKQVARNALETVGLGHRIGHFPNMLSGGEQQRVTIARALAGNPDIVLLDEPTGDLDTSATHHIIALLHRLNTENRTTFLMVTHDPYLKNFADKVVWMRDGKVGRVEHIPAEKKEAALQELRSYIASGVGKNGAELCQVPGEAYSPKLHKHYPPPSVSKSQSLLNELQPTKSWSHTEVREPPNYEAFEFLQRSKRLNAVSKAPSLLGINNQPLTKSIKASQIMTEFESSSKHQSRSHSRRDSVSPESNRDQSLLPRQESVATSREPALMTLNSGFIHSRHQSVISANVRYPPPTELSTNQPQEPAFAFPPPPSSTHSRNISTHSRNLSTNINSTKY